MKKQFWTMSLFVLLLALGLMGGNWTRTQGAANGQTTGTLPTNTPRPPDPTAVPEPTATAVPPVTRYFYTGPIPLIYIEAVKRGEWVSISTKNFPKDTEFKVLMGEYGTLGVNGEEVEVVESEDGGVLEWTFNIPESLAKRNLIAIRLESVSGYYSFNWFWNFDAP